jgi:hypothetical protein
MATESKVVVPSRLPRILSLVVLLAAVSLIVSTYHVFDQTWDESPHIGPGMEWIASHSYTMDLLNSPFPRVIVAMGPYLLGARPHHFRDPGTEGNAILASGNYDALLYSARLGTLLFFIFGVYLVWSRARRWLGEWPALAAVLLFCTCEPVLGHSGVATTDIALMVMYFWAVDRVWTLLTQANVRNGCMAGLAVGLTMVCKHSAAPFMVFAAILLFLLLGIQRLRGGAVVQWNSKAFKPKFLLPVFGISLFIVWAMYFFQVGSIAPKGSQDEQKTTAVLHRLHIPRAPVFAVLDHVPAYGYFVGIRAVRAQNHNEKPSYFMGHLNTLGTHIFYPVLLLIKTPIPFMLFALAGVSLGLLALWRRETGYFTLLIAGAASPFLIATMAHINMGLRHILTVYPFLAILGAWAISAMWRNSVWRAVVGLLLAWQVVACAVAWPDYLPYFNEPTAKHADFFEVDSDLDWGQDLKRLGPKLRSMNVDHVWLAYNGTEDLSRADLPPWQELKPNEKPSGWIAVSVFNIKRRPEDYGWLDHYQPVAMAGKSIKIYRLP